LRPAKAAACGGFGQRAEFPVTGKNTVNFSFFGRFGEKTGRKKITLNPAVEIIRASQALDLAPEIAVFINCGAVGRSSFASRAYASTAGFRITDFRTLHENSLFERTGNFSSRTGNSNSLFRARTGILRDFPRPAETRQ
jgi:hypothetical protein